MEDALVLAAKQLEAARKEAARRTTPFAEGDARKEYQQKLWVLFDKVVEELKNPIV